MKDDAVKTLADVRQILNSAQKLSFERKNRKEAYKFVEKTLCRFLYNSLNKPNKGLIRRYIMNMTGFSRAQTTRLISKYIKKGTVIMKKYKRNSFSHRYSDDDITLLAKTDEKHDCPNGKSLKKILQTEYLSYGKKDFAKISTISVSHIYNLRQLTFYRRIAKSYNPTTPSLNIEIGSREKPYPKGRPGFLRIDTVHQGDKDKEKGLYHINIVDEVTQFEFLAALPQINALYMEPVLKSLLSYFPFKIKNFHSDNGSEYINHKVAKLLNNLDIKQTKSRSRKTNDNALVEGKNGSIIRKHIGYGFMGKEWADKVNQYYQCYYNFYLNFYRPSGFATEKKDKKGKIRKVYREENYKTPYQAFKKIHNYKDYINPNFESKKIEDVIAHYSPTEFAVIMKKARSALFRELKIPNLHIFDIGKYIKSLNSNSSGSSSD